MINKCIKRDTIFIQFYSNYQNSSLNSQVFNGHEYILLNSNKIGHYSILYNGFSSSYEQCKKHGRFHWVEHELSTDIDKLNEIDSRNELPISNGTAYVSAFFNCHLYQSYLWAKRYPSIHFIVGGPAIFIDNVVEKLPSNLEITTISVNQIFKGKSKWGIDLPSNIHDEVLLGFPIDRNCYWGKCTFCNYNEKFNAIDIDYNFIDLLPKKRKYHIFLYTPSASPHFLSNQFHNFKIREDIEYSFFIRGGSEVLSSLSIGYKKCQEAGFDFSKVSQVIGVEFPSNRMLQKLNKGTTIDEILKVIHLMYSKRTKIYCQILLGFNDLIEQDVVEAKDFFTKLYNITDGRAKIKIHNLVCKSNTSIFKNYDIKSKHQLGPFFFGYLPELSSEQQVLNDIVRDCIYDTKFYHILDVYSSKDMKKHEFC